MLHLVRHGRVVDHVLDGRDDPGLSDTGRLQAGALAQVLHPDYLATSPMRRARETARPITACCGLDAVVVDPVGEVVPPGLDVHDRRAFLGGFMGGVWSEQAPELLEWRNSLLEALVELAARGDNVAVVTHYVAINAAAGAALGDDRVTVFHVENTSVSTFEWEGGRLRAVELGHVDHLAS